MYTFNGVTKLIDIMSNTIAQKVDMDGLAFLARDYTTPKYTREFSAKPVGNFNGAPSDWKKEVRGLIDHMATQMVDDTHFEAGYFVVLGNGLDATLIPDIQWTFVGAQNMEMSGVRVNFSRPVAGCVQLHCGFFTQCASGQAYCLLRSHRGRSDDL